MTALCTVLVFVIDTLIIAAVQMLFFLCLCCTAGIPLKKIFPHFKFLSILIVVVAALQLLWGQGLSAGLMIGCRIIALVVLMPMLTMTTDTQLLALGMTRLGLHYRTAFIITAALNVIPSFEEEARLIVDARKLRGIRSARAREYPAIVFPLIIKAMRQAHMTALAMDSRAFGAYRTRTWLLEIKLSAIDYGVFAAGIVWSVAAVTANGLLKG